MRRFFSSHGKKPELMGYFPSVLVWGLFFFLYIHGLNSGFLAYEGGRSSHQKNWATCAKKTDFEKTDPGSCIQQSTKLSRFFSCPITFLNTPCLPCHPRPLFPNQRHHHQHPPPTALKNNPSSPIHYHQQGMFARLNVYLSSSQTG